MTTERIIKALQRSTHLKTWELRRDYPLLFEIQEQITIEQVGLNTRLAGRSIVAEMRRLACPLGHSLPRMD